MLNLIVAPAQYNKNGEKITKKIVHFLKAENKEYSVYFFTNFDELDAQARELTEQLETEFAIIGDELVLGHFLNNVKDITKIKIGIIPISKHDDFANYLEINVNPIQAIKTILENKIEHVDFLIMNNKIVLNNISIGASVELFEIYNSYKIKNYITRKFATLKHANKIEDFEILIDNKTNKPKKEMVYELCVSNGGILNGKHVNPLANVKDGLFNLSYSVDLEAKNKKSYLFKFNTGEQIYNEHTKQVWLSTVSLKKPEGDLKVMADGVIETHPEININIVEGGLKIYR